MSDAEGFERVEVSFDNVRISILRKMDHTGVLSVKFSEKYSTAFSVASSLPTVMIILTEFGFIIK